MALNFDRYLSIKNVEGYSEKLQKKVVNGEKTDIDSARFYVSRKEKESDLDPADILPKKVEIETKNGGTQEVQTDVIPIGKITAPPQPSLTAKAYTERYRPCPGGPSIGHVDITAGTAGLNLWATIDGSKRLVTLSNNHVLANQNRGRKGDPIHQPGPHDAPPTPNTKIGELLVYVPIDFGGGANYQDSGIQESDDPNNLIARQIIDNGEVTEWHLTPQNGELMEATGRTTEHTSSPILDTAATVNVRYGGGRVARFKDQIITGFMARGGDSGSLGIVNQKATGLLFAGSNQATIFNKIKYPKERYNLSLQGNGGGGGQPTARVQVILRRKGDGKGRIEFTVLNSNSTPIPNAQVKITSEADNTLTETTDQVGRATFNNVVIQRWEWTVTKTGYYQGTGTIQEDDFS